MTVAEMIAELQRHDPAAHVLVAHNLGYRLAAVCKIASTEYCLPPVGRPKVAIVPEGT